MDHQNGSNKIEHLKALAAYRDEVLRKQPVLHDLFLEMTVKCNEKCRHCGSNCGDIIEKKALTQADIICALEDVKEHFDISKMRLCITGGEPLLRQDFFEIMNEASQLGYRWGMTTNGSLITPEIAKKLFDTGMETVSVSLDGMRDEHEWFRQRRGCYDETINGIKALLRHQNPEKNKVQITSVIHRKNIHTLDKIYNLCAEMGVRYLRLVSIEPMGRARQNEDLMLEKQDYIRLFNFIKEKRNDLAAALEVSYGCSHYLGLELEREIRNWYFLCNAGIYTASIAYNGDILACLDIERRDETIQGNIKEQPFSKVWKEKFEIFRSDYRKTGPCEQCKDYVFCAGDSFHSWDFENRKPYVCMKEILKKSN